MFKDHVSKVTGTKAMNGLNIAMKVMNQLMRLHKLIKSLTHWGRDKMADISQTTLSSAFSGKEISEFLLRFHWSLFLRVQLIIFQHCFRWRLGADQATSHYLNQGWKVCWCIWASLGLNELTWMKIISLWNKYCPSSQPALPCSLLRSPD